MQLQYHVDRRLGVNAIFVSQGTQGHRNFKRVTQMSTLMETLLYLLSIPIYRRWLFSLLSVADVNGCRVFILMAPLSVCQLSLEVVVEPSTGTMWALGSGLGKINTPKWYVDCCSEHGNGRVIYWSPTETTTATAELLDAIGIINPQ